MFDTPGKSRLSFAHTGRVIPKMYSTRRALFQSLEQARGSKVILFVTGDRPQLETKIATEVYDYFVNHLDLIGVVPKISMVLYTRGGDTLAAWSLVNLIRQFCDHFEIIVPSKAHSAGTLMCLGANNIVMTKQATLGPIDPSLNSPLGPQIPGAAPGSRFPVSVEAINGYLDFAKDELGISDQANLTQVLSKLSDMIHPLVLGQVFRSKSQIQMLARKLIPNQTTDEDKISKIIDFLCSESGSHDYTIHRREARDSLGLVIEKPTAELYQTIKALYDDFASELQFNSRFEPMTFLGTNTHANYALKRAFVESYGGGSNYHVSEGELHLTPAPPTPPGTAPTGAGPSIRDRRTFEGWRHQST